jgi:hypothetical protein
MVDAADDDVVLSRDDLAVFGEEASGGAEAGKPHPPVLLMFMPLAGIRQRQWPTSRYTWQSDAASQLTSVAANMQPDDSAVAGIPKS